MVYKLSEIRVDRVFLPKVSKTKEGYIKGTAIVTRTGVFKYKNADGSDRFELRHPDDVLNIDSLETLKHIPITNEHPNQLVTSENADTLSVGMTGEMVSVDDGEISTSIIITHKDGINAVNSGKQELSLGYSLDVEEEAGVYNGEVYTHRQSNINYNHLAIVEMGRAGRSARLNLDGALYQTTENINEVNVMSNKTDVDEGIVTTEVVEAKSEEKVEVTTIVNDIPATTTGTETTDSIDRKDAIIDELRADNTRLKAINVDALVIEGVKVRLSLLKKAEKVINIDDMYDKNDREIMEKVIVTHNCDVDLTDKSEAYISGRFDAIVESLTNSAGIISQMLNLVNTDKGNKELSGIDILRNHSKKVI